VPPVESGTCHLISTVSRLTRLPIPVAAPQTARPARILRVPKAWTQMSSEVLATKLSKIDRTKAQAKLVLRRTSGCWPLPCGKRASGAHYLTGLLSPVNGRSRPPTAFFPVAPVLKARRRRLLRRCDKLQETAVSQATYEEAYLLSTTRQGGHFVFSPRSRLSIGRQAGDSSNIPNTAPSSRLVSKPLSVALDRSNRCF